MIVNRHDLKLFWVLMQARLASKFVFLFSMMDLLQIPWSVSLRIKGARMSTRQVELSFEHSCFQLGYLASGTPALLFMWVLAFPNTVSSQIWPKGANYNLEIVSHNCVYGIALRKPGHIDMRWWIVYDIIQSVYTYIIYMYNIYIYIYIQICNMHNIYRERETSYIHLVVDSRDHHVVQYRKQLCFPH